MLSVFELLIMLSQFLAFSAVAVSILWFPILRYGDVSDIDPNSRLFRLARWNKR